VNKMKIERHYLSRRQNLNSNASAPNLPHRSNLTFKSFR